MKREKHDRPSRPNPRNSESSTSSAHPSPIAVAETSTEYYRELQDEYEHTVDFTACFVHGNSTFVLEKETQLLEMLDYRFHLPNYLDL